MRTSKTLQLNQFLQILVKKKFMTKNAIIRRMQKIQFLKYIPINIFALIPSKEVPTNLNQNTYVVNNHITSA